MFLLHKYLLHMMSPHPWKPLPHWSNSDNNTLASPLLELGLEDLQISFPLPYSSRVHTLWC